MELYSPDCSPTSQITLQTPDPNSLGRSDETDRLQQSTTSDAAAGAGASAPVLGESKRFEADPALFTDSHGSFSTAWENAQYVLTFNSYIDDLWPALHAQGFTLVITSTITNQSALFSCMIVA